MHLFSCILYNCYKPTLFASGHQWNALSIFSVHTYPTTDVRQLGMHIQILCFRHKVSQPWIHIQTLVYIFNWPAGLALRFFEVSELPDSNRLFSAFQPDINQCSKLQNRSKRSNFIVYYIH